MARASDLPSRSSVVLLTGFGPFPGTPENVSAALARAVGRRAKRELKPHRVHTSILPTEWNAAPERVAGLIARLRPAVALHFGVANGTEGFRIETRGQNACRMTIDAAGRMPPAAHLIPDAPAQYECRLPLDKIINRLTALNLPVAKSDDAGGYLCNSVLYHTLHTQQQPDEPFLAGFIHIPSAFDALGLSFDDAVSGSLEIIKIALDDADKAALTSG